MSVHRLCARCRRSEASVGSPMVVSHIWVLEPKSGPLQEQKCSSLSLSNYLSSILCVWVFRLHVSLCTNGHAWCPWKAEERIRSSGTGIAECCELPCRYEDSNSSPLQDQPVLSTAESANSLTTED